MVWLPLLLQILSNICITIVCYPGCHVIKSEISLIFLIKSFCCITEKSRQKLKYLEERVFDVKWKAFFIIFKGLSAAKNYLRPESAPLISKKRAHLTRWPIQRSSSFFAIWKFFEFVRAECPKTVHLSIHLLENIVVSRGVFKIEHLWWSVFGKIVNSF